MGGKESGWRRGKVSRRVKAVTVLLFSALSLVAPTLAGEPSDPIKSLRISRSLSGGEAPAFSLKTLEGDSIDSKNLQGKVVLLNFWATWCGPCKEEMPALDRLRRQFDPHDFAVYTVTTDLQRDGITAFMHHLGLGLPVLLDEEKEVSSAFLVRGLPTTVLIGRDGKLVGRAVGPRMWDSPEAAALIRTLQESAP